MSSKRAARLISTLAVAGVTALVVPGVASAASGANSLPQLTQGAKGGYVLTLQSQLIAVGYHLQGTGYFGADTKAAVVDWQKNNGIKASGIVGPKTWASLSECGLPDATHAAPLSIKPGQRISAAEAARLESVVDFMQARFVWADGKVPTGAAGAKYQGSYVGAIKLLQQHSGIKPTGVIGPKTSEVINLLESSRDRCVS